MIRHALPLCAVLLTGCLALPSAAPAEKRNETDMLFIGNSFTYYHDLPQLIRTLADAGGRQPLVCAQETPGGCTFEKHWNDGKAVEAIHSRPWDFVVLQEHSRRPVTDRNLMFEYARKLDGEIKKQGAKTLLYMTWSWPGPDDQQAITSAYQQLGNELKAQVVPVGIAWAAALREHPEINLFDGDHHHPSPAGSYLAACTFYAVLYGRTPEGLPAAGGIDDETARMLQKLAYAAVRDLSGK